LRERTKQIAAEREGDNSKDFYGQGGKRSQRDHTLDVSTDKATEPWEDNSKKCFIGQGNRIAGGVYKQVSTDKATESREDVTTLYYRETPD
jgi:hypothetical protein